MRITESQLRKIIRSVIEENEMRDATIAHSGINAPTNFEKAHRDGRVSNMEFYSTGPDSKWYPGHAYTEQQENEAREISKLKGTQEYDVRLNDWCTFHGLTHKDFYKCCAQIGC